MKDDSLFSITYSDILKGERTLLIYSGLDKIEDQIYYTFKMGSRQIVITQYDGEWIDVGGRNTEEADRLGLLIEQLYAVYHPEKDWEYLNPSDFNPALGNEHHLVYDGAIGNHGVEKRVQLPVIGTNLSFDLQRILVAENKVLQKIPVTRLYEILINYNMELIRRPLNVLLRSPDFKPVCNCYFDYVIAENRQRFLVGVTFGEFQPGRYMSQLIALIQTS